MEDIRTETILAGMLLIGWICIIVGWTGSYLYKRFTK